MATERQSGGVRTAIINWREKNLSKKTFMMTSAVLIGFLTGLLCSVLKGSIAWVSSTLTSGFDVHISNTPMLFFPLIGLMATQLLMRVVFKTDLSHGSDWLKSTLDSGSVAVPKKRIYGPIITNILTLGFGGSAGAEGPIAVAGGAIGGNLSKWLGMDTDMIRVMIGCGAGAGIAAIFKAPVGGMLFTLEVLCLAYNTFTVLVLLLACISSWATCFITTGFTFDVYLRKTTFFTPDMYPALLVFGILAGLYSLYYIGTVGVVSKFFRRLGNPFRVALCAAVILGVLLYFFPSLYGEGYGVMDRVLNGDFEALTIDSFFAEEHADIWHFILLIGVLLLVKAVAVACTVDGGVAGDFAPTLFAGSMCGLIFALMANHIFGTHLPVGDFALIGMSAVFSGIIRAPFMAMILTSEMTGNFTLLLPMVLASALSFGVVRLFKNGNFYHRARIKVAQTEEQQ